MKAATTKVDLETSGPPGRWLEPICGAARGRRRCRRRQGRESRRADLGAGAGSAGLVVGATAYASHLNGSNDLSQLLLGADRDSELVAEVFDDRDPAVTGYIVMLLELARVLGRRTSICGQAPSVHPEYAEFLVECGIDAILVNVDAVERARRLIAAAERRLLLASARAQGGKRS